MPSRRWTSTKPSRRCARSTLSSQQRTTPSTDNATPTRRRPDAPMRAAPARPSRRWATCARGAAWPTGGRGACQARAGPRGRSSEMHQAGKLRGATAMTDRRQDLPPLPKHPNHHHAHALHRRRREAESRHSTARSRHARAARPASTATAPRAPPRAADARPRRTATPHAFDNRNLGMALRGHRPLALTNDRRPTKRRHDEQDSDRWGLLGCGATGGAPVPLAGWPPSPSHWSAAHHCTGSPQGPILPSRFNVRARRRAAAAAPQGSGGPRVRTAGAL